MTILQVFLAVIVNELESIYSALLSEQPEIAQAMLSQLLARLRPLVHPGENEGL